MCRLRAWTGSWHNKAEHPGGHLIEDYWLVCLLTVITFIITIIMALLQQKRWSERCSQHEWR